MKYLWTTISVENMEESIRFYTTLVGLKLLRRFPAGAGVELAFLGNGVDGETMIELMADSSIGTIGFNEFISIGFAVASIDEMLAIIQREKIPVYNGPVETPGSFFFTVQDPDGLQVQFFQQKAQVAK